MNALQAPSCSRCGGRLPENAVFCPACGTRVAGSQQTFSRYPPALVASRRRLVRGLGAIGGRARALAETTAIRSRAQTELNRLRYTRLEALERRGTLLAELGAAVYENDNEATERIRGEIAKLDERVAATEAQMRELAAEAEERVRKAALPVQDTEVADRSAEGSSD